MRRWRGRLVIAIALAAGILACWPTGRLHLVISSMRTGERLITWPLAAGERFTLCYVHSVDGTPIWEEHYADRAGRIHLAEERFVLLGAGMGHWPGHGTLTLRDSLQVIEHIDRAIGDFVVRVGDRAAGQTIRCGDREVRLCDIAADQPVLISVAPISLAGALGHWLDRRATATLLAER